MATKEKISINEMIANPELLNSEGTWSFCDWFCPKSDLEKRAKSLLPKVKFLVDQKIIDGDKTYLWFKNSSSCFGMLYDSFGIVLIENDIDIFDCVLKSGHDFQKNSCNIWGTYFDITMNSWEVFKQEIRIDARFKNKLIESVNKLIKKER